MKHREYSHKHGADIVRSNPELESLYQEIISIIDSISDDEIQTRFNAQKGASKSISKVLNSMMKESFVNHGWNPESKIFHGDKYSAWRLDFSKPAKSGNRDVGIAVEVAFNHSGSVAWNLIKPVLASEMNHVEKETNIGNGIGVLICATDDCRVKGGFDNAIGTYEGIIDYLIPLERILSTPLIVIGLEAPESFIVKHTKVGNRNVGSLVPTNP